ncbi:MAG: hypothetical protein ACRCSP_00700 [Rhodoglobus sp.]
MSIIIFLSYCLLGGGAVFELIRGHSVTFLDLSSISLGFVVITAVLWWVPLVTTVVREQGGWSRWHRWYRLENFASANGMLFSPGFTSSRSLSRSSTVGEPDFLQDNFRSAQGRFFVYGNCRRTVEGYGPRDLRESTQCWGALALELDRSLPQMILRSTATKGRMAEMFHGFTKDRTLQLIAAKSYLAELFEGLDKNQILSLEGDFDKYFTLYCPRSYERDALYIFTPDLMALLIDNAAPLTIEIKDNWMFVYSQQEFDLLQPATHHRLRAIMNTVGAKLLDNSEAYVDARATNAVGAKLLDNDEAYLEEIVERSLSSRKFVDPYSSSVALKGQRLNRRRNVLPYVYVAVSVACIVAYRLYIGAE